mmetsp:Transcript_3640/g.8461  ORF Transcript_3640/g.8461 Transcript_3640/m.8461 type:complete len:238 (+) Transcript_3640:347-1060(+)
MDAVTHVHVRISSDHLLDTVKGEWSNLLDRGNGHVLETQPLPFCHQLVVNLPAAEDQALHLLWVGGDLWVSLADQPLKAGVCLHLAQRADTLLKAEQVLGRGHNHRLPEVPMLLSAQGVEIVRWCGQVHDLPICSLHLTPAETVLEVGDVVLVVIAELQKTFNAAGGMLSSLTHVTVGQQHDDAGLLEPLVLASRDELISHHLCGVREIAELRLPKDKGSWVFVTVAKLKPDHGIFG